MHTHSLNKVPEEEKEEEEEGGARKEGGGESDLRQMINKASVNYIIGCGIHSVCHNSLGGVHLSCQELKSALCVHKS